MKHKSSLNILKTVYTPVFHSPRLLLSTIIFAICGGLSPIIMVTLLQFIVTLLALPELSIPAIMTPIALLIGLAAALEIISVQCEKRSYHRFTALRMGYILNILHVFMTMDFAYYENAVFMDSVNSVFRGGQSNDTGVEGIYHHTYKLAKSVVTILALGAMFFAVSFWIIGAITIMLVLLALFNTWNSRYKHSQKQMINETRRKTSLYQQETSDFSYGKDIRLFHLQGAFQSAYQQAILHLKSVLHRFYAKERWLSVADSLIMVLGDGIVLYFLIRALSQGLSLASFVMYLGALALLTKAMKDISDDIAFIREELLYVNDMLDFLEADLISETSDHHFKVDGPIDVEFRHVSFRYPNTDQNVYTDLNLHIKAGKKIALVGVNGAGKTTLIKLLCGLYRPDSGQILINGIDYLEFSIQDLFRLFAVVFQEVEPLALTIKENVCACLDGDAALVEEVLKQVGLWDKINTYERGIDSMMLKVIDESGIVLSGGENQKLMIARALYRQTSSMIIMDEPTAALDALAEEKIYQEFSAMTANKTSIYISHRLASTQFCDYIVLLNGGSIESAGTHKELLAQNGTYATMFKTQGKYYQEDYHEENTCA